MGYYITYRKNSSSKARFLRLPDWEAVIRWLKRMEGKCACIYIEKEELQ